MNNHQGYKSAGTFVPIWLIKSEDLYQAAEAVWHYRILRIPLSDGTIDETHLLSSPALLLMGLSLEALLKGLIISRTPDMIANGKVSKRLSKHDLCALFDMASIPIHEERNGRFLAKLTQYIVWRSKYPVPVTSNYGKHGLLAQRDDDFETFKRLYKEVAAHFKIEEMKVKMPKWNFDWYFNIQPERSETQSVGSII